jgi:tetratricopeptide (TPR) repeat protein
LYAGPQKLGINTDAATKSIAVSNMAEYLFSRNQLGEAIEQYQLAAGLTSKWDVTLFSYINAADALRTLGDSQTAEMMLTRALRIDPTNAAARNLLQEVKR